MGAFETIKAAIINKQQITATYNGYYREMCPHVLGHKNGKLQCLFYQFGGTSSSGLSPDERKNWRCIPVDALINVKVQDGEWYSAVNHARPQTCVDDVIVEVEF